MLTAFILASGFSKRMGQNKLLLKLEDKFIIEYIIETLTKVCFDDIFLVTSTEKIIEIGKENGIRTIKNETPEKGQSESIKLGIMSSNLESNYMFFVADQPFLKEEIILKCIEVFEKDKEKIIIPICKGKRCNPVIFPNKFRNDFLKLSGDFGGKQIIMNNQNLVREINFDDSISFMDIDYKEDLELLKKIRKL